MIDQAEWMNEWIAIDQGNLFFHLSMHLKDQISDWKSLRPKPFGYNDIHGKMIKGRIQTESFNIKFFISPTFPSKYEKNLKLLNAVVFTSAWPFSS